VIAANAAEQQSPRNAHERAESEGERYLHNRLLPERPLRRVEVILRDRLEPVHTGTSVEDVPVVLGAQAHSEAELRPGIHTD
jgi:hypothetical protein